MTVELSCSTENCTHSCDYQCLNGDVSKFGGPTSMSFPRTFCTGTVWMMSVISFSTDFWARIWNGSQSSLCHWPVSLTILTVSERRGKGPRGPGWLIYVEDYGPKKIDPLEIPIFNQSKRMGFRSVYPDSVLTPHLALLNPIAMLIDRWMALMFALGWIPALDRTWEDLCGKWARWAWEARTWGLCLEDTVFDCQKARRIGWFSNVYSSSCVGVFFAFPALEEVEVGTTDVWFICTVGWSKMLTLEMVSPLLRGWKPLVDDSTISEHGWQIWPMVHQQSDWKWGS